MTLRITPFALAALLAVGVGCGESGTTGGSANQVDLESMDEFGQIAYAFGFESAQGAKADSASFKFFEFGTFEDGFRDGLAGDSSRIAYLFGFEIGNRLGRDTTTNLDADIFLQGFREGLDSDSLRISDEELQRISGVVQDSLRMRQLRQLAETDTSAQARLNTIRDNAAEAATYLAEVEAGGDVTTSESGLLYTVTEPGTGAEPTEQSVVVVNYTGRLADGTVFDASEPNEPRTFDLRQLTPGFREGVMLLKEGGSATLYVPPSLGYGQEGTPGGPIPPNAALVFDIELVEVMSTQEAGQPVPPPPPPPSN